MGARWLYALPALVLSALAIVLALVGLSREPTPVEIPTESSSGFVMQVTEEQIEEALEHRYWVALKDLSIGAELKEEDFRAVGVSVPLPDALPSDEPIDGRSLRRNLRAGEIIARAHLEAVNRLAQEVPSGFRAFALSINDVSSVGGMLQPGDLVDVVVHFSRGQDDEPTALFLLNSIEVLAVYGRMEEAVGQQEEERQQRGSNRGSNTVVLAIPREDIPRLLVADTNGAIRLALAGSAREKTDSQLSEDEQAAWDAFAQLEEGEAADTGDSTAAAKQAKTTKEAAEIDPVVATKLDDVVPESKKKATPQRAAPARPRGERVEVIEGSSSRSTYVH